MQMMTDCSKGYQVKQTIFLEKERLRSKATEYKTVKLYKDAMDTFTVKDLERMIEVKKRLRKANDAVYYGISYGLPEGYDEM